MNLSRELLHHLTGVVEKVCRNCIFIKGDDQQDLRMTSHTRGYILELSEEVKYRFQIDMLKEGCYLEIYCSSNQLSYVERQRGFLITGAENIFVYEPCKESRALESKEFDLRFNAYAWNFVR